jgi:hypothetical protein
MSPGTILGLLVIAIIVGIVLFFEKLGDKRREKRNLKK